MADIEKILRRFGEWGEKTRTTLAAIGRYKDFLVLFAAPREHGQQVIEQVVRDSTPEQLSQFERELVQCSVHIYDGAQRIRAMELYAWLKILETQQYAGFRGFGANGGV